MKKKFIILLGIVATLVLCSAYLFFFKDKSNFIQSYFASNNKKSSLPQNNNSIVEEKKPIKKAVSITTQNVKLSNLDVYEKSVGIVYNLDSSFISAETSGVVKSVNVEIGDYVNKNQVLAQIDKEELENTRNAQISEINKIKAQLKDQEKNLVRYKSLYKNGYVSQSELDAISTNVKTLKEQLSSAKAMLANYNIVLEKSVIKSKIQGIIQERSISKGTFVSIGTPLFTIVDNSNLLILANYPQFFSSIVKKDQAVVVEIDENKIIKTKIKEIKPVVDEQTRSLQVIIELPNNEYKLKPGETVNVKIIIQKKSNIILLKEEAVVLRNKGKVVYIIKDNIVEERLVKTGVSQDGLIEITDGLQGGEEIALEGAGFLSNNANINILAN